ncbi:MAG: ornithine cyclodeaminase family protein [Candidatus Tectomicrobia bacterium]|nr:ornithine cyclodeaminase family protein [Candidatus Tectomicrobia bacterium]
MAELKFLYVPTADAERLLDMPTALRLVEEDFVHTAEGNGLYPQGRMMQLWLPKAQGHHYFFSKMCGLRRQGVMGFRCAAANSDNPGRGLPESFRYILLVEMESCRPLGLVDETWSWELRTGAEAGVAAKHLARPDSRRVGLLGAGRMARTSLTALCEVLPIREVRVTSRRPESREAFSRRMTQDLGVPVIPAATVEEALQGADVVVTATTANAPLVTPPLLGEGSLLLSMGTHQELDPEAFRRIDKVVPDDWEKCKLWGDLAAGLRSGAFTETGLYAELGDIVSGKRPGRERQGEIILCVPQGMITQDIALAHFVYERALAQGLGRWVDL